MNVKSIRKDLFECLNKHGEQTMDDLVTRLGDWTRGQLSNNVQAARKEGLATSRKDDVTGAPAYKLTAEGKARLSEIVARDKANAHLSDPAPVSKPVTRGSRTTEVITQLAHDNELPDLRTKLSDFELVMANVRKALKLSENESIVLAIQLLQGDNASLQDDIRRQTQRASAAEANRDDLKKMLDEVAESTSADMRLIEELKSQIETKDRIIESMSEEATQSKEVKEAAIGYLIRVPGKRSLIRSKPEGAHAAAMSSARAHGRADVLALIPVGKAVRGAEWRDAS